MNGQYYYSTDYTYLSNLARKAENESNWEEAKRIHKLLGRKDDVAAIDLIIESKRLGDAYRAILAEQDVFGRHERRQINNAQLNELLNEAHKRVYGG